MTRLAPLGIKRLEGIHYYVHDLERSRRFYTDKLDFAETWRSSPELEHKTGQRSAGFSAGDIQVLCSAPIGPLGQASCRAARRRPPLVGPRRHQTTGSARGPAPA